MEEIRDAFERVKNDMSSINKKIDFLNNNLSETRSGFVDICDIVSSVNNTNVDFDKRLSYLEKKDVLLDKKIDKLTETLEKMNMVLGSFTSKMMSVMPVVDNKKESKDKYLDIETGKFIDLDISLDNKTNIPSEKGVLSVDCSNIQTDKTDIKPRNAEYQGISTGNGGVQTDNPTDRQTDNFVKNSSHNQEKLYNDMLRSNSEYTHEIDDAVDILDSLDSLKKEIRLKFRRLTDQELTVFATIYQLEEELGYSDYKTISRKLNLTESSIRDYVRRLINKGIPIEKNKINNKGINLIISKNLKKIASLNTILELRDL